MGRTAHLFHRQAPANAAVRSGEMATTGQGRTSVRVNVAGTGTARVDTGLSVLDHLLELLAERSSFDIALEVEPAAGEVEIGVAARALGEALAPELRAEGV